MDPSIQKSWIYPTCNKKNIYKYWRYIKKDIDFFDKWSLKSSSLMKKNYRRRIIELIVSGVYNCWCKR